MKIKTSAFGFKKLFIAVPFLIAIFVLTWFTASRKNLFDIDKSGRQNDWVVFYDVKRQKTFSLNLVTGSQREAPKDSIIGNNRIFYTSNLDEGGIYSQDFDGDNAIKLVSFKQSNEEKFWMVSPRIISTSPNDSKILFILVPSTDPFIKKEIDSSFNYGYYIFDVNVGDTVLVSKLEDVVNPNNWLYEVLEWDEKSQPILRYRDNIYFFDLENKTLNPLVDSPYDTRMYADLNSIWISGLTLSDDKQLAVYQLAEYADSDRKSVDMVNSAFALEAYDRRSNKKITLIEKTFKGERILNISISPDKKIAYTYNRDLWVYDLTDSKRSMVFGDDPGLAPNYPIYWIDNENIFFGGHDFSSYIVNIKNKNVTKIAENVTFLSRFNNIQSVRRFIKLTTKKR